MVHSLHIDDIKLNSEVPFMKNLNIVSFEQFVGPMADNSQALFGDYASNLNKKYTKSPWAGLKQMGNMLHQSYFGYSVICNVYVKCSS